MLIFNNTLASQAFSVVLRDKLVNDSPVLTMKLTKLDDFSEEVYLLTNTSTSEDYYTFEINPSTLEQGDYKAVISQGFGATADCIVSSPETVSIPTTFDCDPMFLTSELTIEDLAVFVDVAPDNLPIYITKCRVEGPEYNTYYRNTAEPEYYVYNE